MKFIIEHTKERHIVMVEVDSSLIKGVGYDAPKKEMFLKFQDGSVYQYQNVPALLYSKMMLAESIGGYFSEHIKREPEKYPYTKLELVGESKTI